MAPSWSINKDSGRNRRAHGGPIKENWLKKEEQQ